jgi:hypothetical protein
MSSYISGNIYLNISNFQASPYQDDQETKAHQPATLHAGPGILAPYKVHSRIYLIFNHPSSFFGPRTGTVLFSGINMMELALNTSFLTFKNDCV